MKMAESRLKVVASLVGVGAVIGCILGCAPKNRVKVEYVLGPECKTVIRLRCTNSASETPSGCRIVSFKHVVGCERLEVGKESK